MKREIIKIEGNEDDPRPYHLLVTRQSTDEPDMEEVTVNFMMNEEERASLIEHVAGMAGKEGCVGFNITFSINVPPGSSDGGLGFFAANIKGRQ